MNELVEIRSSRAVAPPGGLWREIAVALSIGAVLCAIRLAMFDYPVFFGFRGIPNHDSLSAAAAFNSSLHALRIEGDIAWWLPGPDGGYAQYYNFFLSPLAPTAGSPEFIAWSSLIWLASMVGIVVPEYAQFLVFNWMLMPSLAYAALVLLARGYCQTWLAPTLFGAVYAFGGLGIWNNAWMFYQEWFHIFLMLWALDAFSRGSSRGTLLALAGSLFLLVASANYWTVFAVWFVAVWTGAHVFLNLPRWRAAVRWTALLHWSGGGAGVALAVASLASVAAVATVGLVYLEQDGQHVRASTAAGLYSLDQVWQRAHHTDVRFFTTELFNPVIERAITGYKVVNEAHNAVYIGAMLLPLLMVFLVTPWRRRDMHLFIVFGFLCSIVTISGLFLLAWQITPGLNRIQHMFYFYHYFFRLVVALMACIALDRLAASWTAAETGPASRAAMAAVALGGAGLAFLFLASEQFQAPLWAADATMTPNHRLQSIGLASLLVLLGGLLVYRIGVERSKSRRLILLGLFVLICTGDLVRYYWRASIADQTMTVAWRGVQPKDGALHPAVAAALAKPWPPAFAEGEFPPKLYGLMPITTGFWPQNEFNPTMAVTQFRGLPPSERSRFETVSLAGASPALDQADVALDGSAVSMRPLRTGYNGAVLEIEAQRAGFLVIPLNFDPYWRATVDGVAAKVARAAGRLVAVPVGAGRHTVELTYAPPSRSVYAVSRKLTLLALLCFAYAAFRGRDDRSDVSSYAKFAGPVRRTKPGGDAMRDEATEVRT